MQDSLGVHALAELKLPRIVGSIIKRAGCLLPGLSRSSIQTGFNRAVSHCAEAGHEAGGLRTDGLSQPGLPQRWNARILAGGEVGRGGGAQGGAVMDAPYGAKAA